MLDILVIFLYAFSQCRLGEAVECSRIDRCSCELTDGSGRIIDLSKIGKQGGEPLIQNVAGSRYLYSFNPCYPFSEGTCKDVAGCQTSASGEFYFDIGDPDTVLFDYDGTDLTAKYTSTDLARQSIVKYVCDPGIDPPHAIVAGETSTGTYLFSITSKYACPGPERTGNCTQLDPCSCQFDDGRGVVDLSVLAKHRVPLISDIKSSLYYYSFNPCFPFNEGDCKEVVGCQLENTTGVYIDIADATKVSIYADGTNIVGNYTSLDGSRTTIVTYVCDAAKETPIIVVNGEVARRTYGITIISKDVCPRTEL